MYVHVCDGCNTLCQLRRQLHLGSIRGVVLHQDECVRWLHPVGNRKYICRISYSLLGNGTSLKVIPSIHSTNVGIVQGDGPRTRFLNPSCVPRRTISESSGWQLIAMAVTTFRSSQADADTLPFCTVMDSPLCKY